MSSPWSNVPKIEENVPVKALITIEDIANQPFQIQLKDADDVSDFLLMCKEAHESFQKNPFTFLKMTAEELMMATFDITKDKITLDQNIEKSYIRILDTDAPCGFFEYKMTKGSDNGKNIPISKY